MQPQQQQQQPLLLLLLMTAADDCNYFSDVTSSIRSFSAHSTNKVHCPHHLEAAPCRLKASAPPAAPPPTCARK
jgi:hypothetical protein